ncbi:MAG TPA: plastocyanin/azurin family copper-binding protein [Solirubrobacteraceae bacterium]
MHAAVLQLAPILGAEKSKVPFYIAGGALVAWALIVSLGLGMRMPDFPRTKGAERGVIAVTALLVLAAVSTAVLTSGGSIKAVAATTPASPASQAPPSGGAAPASSAPVPASPAPVATPTATTGTPTATTGTPAPPSSPAHRAPSGPLMLAANPAGQLSYNTKHLSAPAGAIAITMTNMSPLEHNVTVAQGSTVLGATPTFKGGAKTLTLNLKPGTYTFYCSVPGHRQAGMEGTLTVS